MLLKYNILRQNRVLQWNLWLSDFLSNHKIFDSLFYCWLLLHNLFIVNVIVWKLCCVADKIGTDITKYVSSDIDTSKIESGVGFGARTTIVVHCGMCRLCHINLLGLCSAFSDWYKLFSNYTIQLCWFNLEHIM